MYKILLIGLGNIGLRHLESLAKLNFKFDIYVYDIDKHNTQKAKDIWEDEQLNFKLNNKIYICTNYKKLPKEIDLTIVSTLSSNRDIIIHDVLIVNGIICKYWIIEKLLGQSEHQINSILGLLKNCKAWVNTPRRVMPWYKEIKKILPKKEKLKCVLEGYDWGIACNSIHFIDLFCWLTEEEILSFDNSNLDKFWKESKREGFYEVTGKLNVNLSQGSSLSLISSKQIKGLKVKILTRNNNFILDFKDGIFTNGKDVKLYGNDILISDLTKDVVSSILLKDKCELPTLEVSARHHKLFIKSLIEHWNIIHDTDLKYIPIT